MARLQLELDTETAERLMESAVAERRPVVWQAEVLLRRALGLPFPVVRDPANPEGDPATVGGTGAVPIASGRAA
jgi:hypothetical protein